MKLKRLLAVLCAVSLLFANSAFAAPEEDSEKYANEYINDTETLEIEPADETDDLGNSELSAELLAETQIFDGGSGTEEDPFLISNADQLILINDLNTFSFKLTKDIEVTDWNNIVTFNGTFDGNGHKISGFTKLFVGNNKGTVKNTKFVTIDNGIASCAIVASANNGTITNCSAEGSVSCASSSSASGFVDYNNGTITNCYFSGSVFNKFSDSNKVCYTSGFVSENSGTITNCYVDGDISSEEGSATGFVYFNNYYGKGTITNCYFKGKVNAPNGNAYGFVCNPYYSVYQKDNSGYYRYYYEGTITNCYSVPTLNGSKTYGFGSTSSYHSGYNSYYSSSSDYYWLSDYTTFISDCYYNRQISGCSETNAASPTYTLAMKMAATYTGWDFDNVWETDASINDGYPYLQAVMPGGGSSFVTDIQLDRTNAILSVDETLYLNASLTPADTGKSVSWTSSDYSIASVSQNGVVTAIAPGKAVITASVGLVKAECSIEVADNAVKVTGVSLDKTSLNLALNEDVILTAAVVPDDATSKSITWSNSNPQAVSFDETTGKITGLSVGDAVITATTNDGGYSASCNISVFDNSVKVVSVTLDKSETGISVGENVTLKASIQPVNATNAAIKWSSTNPNVAVVSDSGVVTGIAEGTAQIYATAAGDSSCYAICRVTVAKQKVAVTGIELSSDPFGNPFEVNIGKTLILSPSIKPSNATNKDIKWTSSDKDVATVENGTVTGIAEGTATITATTVDGGYSAECKVKVIKPTVYVTGIALNAEQMVVNVKETKQLTAAVTPVDATDKGITFKSNNNAIATVSEDGKITGVAPGTTLIQAISDTTSGRYIAFCTVTVPKPIVEVTSIKLDKSSLEIIEGKTIQLKAVIKPSNATYKNVTWSVSDESVATVSQDGYVTAHGVGEAVVSATSANGKIVNCNITVLPSDTPAKLKAEDATVKAGKQIPVTISIASNPGISTFQFDLKYDNTKMYPVSYAKGDILNNVSITTPLGSQDFSGKNSVRFVCATSDSKNIDNDGDLMTVTFQTLDNADYGDAVIEIVPSALTNQNYEPVNFEKNDCTMHITDYTIGDVNCDDVVDLKDSMILKQYIAGFDVALTPQGKKAAVSIYPDNGDNVETSEPTLNDIQHLFRYLADWQVELGKK